MVEFGRPVVMLYERIERSQRVANEDATTHRGNRNDCGAKNSMS